MKKYPICGIVVITLLATLIPFPSLPTVSAATGTIYTVNTTADPGNGICDAEECTLREAIITTNNQLNGTAPDEIHFNITSGCDTVSGVCTIAPTTALPVISEAVIIDGYTQPGASANTITVGSNARLLIELSGENAPDFTDGITITSANTKVSGLVINRFKRNGIRITGSIAAFNTIQGNFIGTDASGKLAQQNQSSGLIINGATYSYIGGSAPVMRNLISGNGAFGVEINGSSASYNYVFGNYIGTDVSGKEKLPNLAGGVEIAGAQRSSIGGSNAGNLISGNQLDGIRLITGTVYTTVWGNKIGTDITGTTSLGNQRSGIYIDGATFTDIGNQKEPQMGNVISGNGAAGVQVLPAGANTAYQNTITLNSIYRNGGLGIDLGGDGVTPNDPGDIDSGPNQLQNFPLITGFDGSMLNGALQIKSGTAYAIELFASADCDPSGYGEGQKTIKDYYQFNTTTNAFGYSDFSIPITPIRGMPYITATATNYFAGNTSEFSPCYVPDATALTINPKGVSIYGESITLTTTVTTGDLANPYPSGLVQFKDGDTPLGDPVALDAFGQVTYTTSTLAIGTHTLTAEFLGNEAYPPSSGSLVYVVNPFYTVTTSSDYDDGACDESCSLREAIRAANVHPNGAAPDEIHFNIQDCLLNSFDACIINLRYTLPAITDPVVIDGYTQPGASANTLTEGNNASLRIWISTNLPSYPIDGLVINGDGSTVRGLVISGFGGRNGGGIHIIGGSAGNLVQGNFIGMFPDGTEHSGNGRGIYLESSSNNTIGGTEPWARNLISSNDGDGLLINGNGNLVQGNYIGTVASGAAGAGNRASGVRVSSGANNKIGGSEAGASNLISGNRGNGITIENGAKGTLVQGNSIYGNTGLGIDLNADGVSVNDAGDTDTGANQLQNFPLLFPGVLNSTASTTFRVEFFANSTCDASGYGEGEEFLGTQEIVTDERGNATFPTAYTPPADKPYLTATATNLVTGDTSEFSPCVKFPGVHLFASAPASTYGESATFNVVVIAEDPAAPTPTGLVQFKDGETPLGEPVALDAAGQAAYTTSALIAGPHTLVAEYLGDGANPTSSATLDFSVSPAATTLALSISSDPAILNRPVTLTAVVTAAPPGSGIPTGLVTFADGDIPLSTATLVMDGSGGARAEITVVLQTPGPHRLKAAFGGDSNFTGSDGAITVETRALLYLPFLAQ